MPCMQRARATRASLARVDRLEAGLHQAREHTIGGDEGVLLAPAFVRRRSEHGRNPLPDSFEG